MSTEEWKRIIYLPILPHLSRVTLSVLVPSQLLVCSLHQNGWHSSFCKYPKRQVWESSGKKQEVFRAAFTVRIRPCFISSLTKPQWLWLAISLKGTPWKIGFAFLCLGNKVRALFGSILQEWESDVMQALENLRYKGWTVSDISYPPLQIPLALFISFQQALFCEVSDWLVASVICQSLMSSELHHALFPRKASLLILRHGMCWDYTQLPHMQNSEVSQVNISQGETLANGR